MQNKACIRTTMQISLFCTIAYLERRKIVSYLLYVIPLFCECTFSHCRGTLVLATNYLLP